MAFLNALAAAITIIAVAYAGLNAVFIAQMSKYEQSLGAGEVWLKRLLKSLAVATVGILWAIFG